MDIIQNAGKKLYHLNRWKERKRYLFFRFRMWWHKEDVAKYLQFFEDNTLRQQILWNTPSFLEQISRRFFYKNSTWQERINLIQHHIEILENKLTTDTLNKIYVSNQPILIWQDEYDNKPLTLDLRFHSGQRKEGCLCLLLQYDKEWLYQIIFWLDGDINNPIIYIGAIQGMLNGSDLIKNLTKAYFGYRTKNLIFYCLRAFARELNCKAIYGVTNDGYYAMNGLRFDRKLKTDFGEFWQECEGIPAEDKRFYKMPINEHRKSMEELKPSKRAQHRRRFEKLDQIDAAIHLTMQNILK
ncbi:MAG: DUF535 domain-containing protein [Phascolarctobacterium sp.]|nr:DUF535 domain-containing protein [Candidatus Phascolarctobacterium caballi]